MSSVVWSTPHRSKPAWLHRNQHKMCNCKGGSKAHAVAASHINDDVIVLGSQLPYLRANSRPVKGNGGYNLAPPAPAFVVPVKAIAVA